VLNVNGVFNGAKVGAIASVTVGRGVFVGCAVGGIANEV
jgi:hypothetical protein